MVIYFICVTHNKRCHWFHDSITFNKNMCVCRDIRSITLEYIQLIGVLVICEFVELRIVQAGMWYDNWLQVVWIDLDRYIGMLFPVFTKTWMKSQIDAIFCIILYTTKLYKLCWSATHTNIFQTLFLESVQILCWNIQH